MFTHETDSPPPQILKIDNFQCWQGSGDQTFLMRYEEKYNLLQPFGEEFDHLYQTLDHVTLRCHFCDSFPQKYLHMWTKMYTLH